MTINKYMYEPSLGMTTDEYGFVQEDNAPEKPITAKPQEQLPEGYKWVRVVQGKRITWEQAHNIHKEGELTYAVILQRDLSLESISSYDGILWYIDYMVNPNDHTGEVHEEPEEKFLAMLDDTKYTPSVGKKPKTEPKSDPFETWVELIKRSDYVKEK